MMNGIAATEVASLRITITILNIKGGNFLPFLFYTFKPTLSKKKYYI